METPVDQTPADGHPKVDELGAIRALLRAIQSRIFGGLLVALPIAITAFILYWLYTTLKQFVLDPTARLINYFGGYRLAGVPGWWEMYLNPPIAIVLVLVLLYFLGHFVHTRLWKAVDWVLLRLPLVTIVYKTVRNVFQSLQGEGGASRFKRVVLVPFPHPGMRALAFVTKSLQDAETHKTVLAVCVLTSVVPPTGFTLFVPEEDVTAIDWTVNQTLQAILSGGITAPASIHYFQGVAMPTAAGPLVDTVGRPIETR